MKKRVGHFFEVSEVYLAQHRLNRYFFEVVSRSALTLTVKLRGYQENYSQFRPTPMLEPNDDQLQKIRVHINKDTDSEYGYVMVKYDLWGHPEQAKVAIDGRDVVHHLI